MSYLLDKKIKRKKIFNIVLGAVFLSILFYFRSGVFNGLSNISQKIFHPILILGADVGGKLEEATSYFISNNSLFLENQNLKSQLNAEESRMANYDSLFNENISLKEILGRKKEKVSIVLATILAKPNRSVYDTLLIDAGAVEGIKTGDTVFAFGDVPIGRVDLVYENSSKVVLFSDPGEKTQVVVSGKPASPENKDIYMEITGRGGGNFEIILPKGFILQKGDQVVMPGISPYVLAITESIISDPRDPFVKFLLRSPVNIQELKFVEVEL